MSGAVPPETAAATGASRHQGTRARPAAARIEDAVIATAVLALLAAACVIGGGPAATVADTPGQQALKYSQCIRSHGVPGFPDPDSQGPTRHHTQRSPEPGLTAAPDGATALPAPGAKRHHHHQRPDAAHLRQATRQALKFVACMRGARWAQNHLSARR